MQRVKAFYEAQLKTLPESERDKFIEEFLNNKKRSDKRSKASAEEEAQPDESSKIKLNFANGVP